MKRGGKRPRAGRPKSGRERVQLRLLPESVKHADKCRGPMGRNQWFDKVIKRQKPNEPA